MKRKTTKAKKVIPWIGNVWFVVALEHGYEGPNRLRLRVTLERVLSTSDAVEALAALRYSMNSASPARIHALPPARGDGVKR